MIAFPSETRVSICGINAHECGYCKSESGPKTDSSISYGITADVMTVEDYESMMLLGWRRSGTYFYKPIMYETCCPQYTIRLRVGEFKYSKSQKKVLKNVAKYLNEAGTLQSTRLTIELEASTFTEEKFELYKRYQVDDHKDKPEDVTAKGFQRFLVTSPLVDPKTSPRPNPAFQYGSFHQMYRLDGRLIAVGVVDLLPSGLSSVYVFYDNDLKQLTLGKYTALKEIEFCKEHNFPYYYMGFYVHSCEKMRYKSE